LDDEDESEHETSSSIDEHSLSLIDLSSKLSSLNNSENDNNEEIFDENVL